LLVTELRYDTPEALAARVQTYTAVRTGPRSPQESLWIGYWRGTADILSSSLTALTAARLTGIHRKDAKL
jgi:hypothetical protein